MIYKTPKCPICGELAGAEVDLIPGLAIVNHYDDGLFEYEGTTDVQWDDQKNFIKFIPAVFMSLDVEYRMVTCGDHAWVTEVKEKEQLI